MTPLTRDAVEQELKDAMTGGNWELVKLLCRDLDALETPEHRVPVGAAALWYAAHRIPVFPLQPRLKIPFPRSRGVLDATTDEATIRGWFERHPDANLGLATGHLIDVVDFDGLKAHAAWPFRDDGQRLPFDVADALKHAEADWGGMSILATVSTPRPGGLHVYVRASGRGNKAGWTPGVDYRGRGGYVLAPPSVLDAQRGQHPGTYRFLRRLNPELL